MPLVFGRAPAGNQQVRAFQVECGLAARAEEAHPFARLAVDVRDFGVGHDVDSFVAAHFLQALRNVFVLVMGDAAIAVEERHLGSRNGGRPGPIRGPHSPAPRTRRCLGT